MKKPVRETLLLRQVNGIRDSRRTQSAQSHTPPLLVLFNPAVAAPVHESGKASRTAPASEVEYILVLLREGADKISVNSAAIDDPTLISRAADKFGSQCVVVAIDARRRRVGKAADPSLSYSESIKINDEWQVSDGWTIYKNGGRVDMGIDAIEWAKKCEALGAGEILLTSMDADGTKDGYDNELTRLVAENVGIPVIASGGAGKLEDFYDTITYGKADAALAASLFHFKELEIKEVKEYLRSKDIPVRL